MLTTPATRSAISAPRRSEYSEHQGVQRHAAHPLSRSACLGMSEYWLASHAYVCVTENHAVILDLRNDRYIAVPNTQALALRAIVRGWPTVTSNPSPSNAVQDTDASAKKLVSRMLSMQLLTSDPRRGRNASPVAADPPRAALLETVLLHTLLGPEVTPPPVCFMDVVKFLWAFLRARLSLRLRSLEHVIQRVHERKTQQKNRPADIHAMRNLVSRFRLIRPFVYTVKNECLFDAYMLIEYLALYGQYPNWIFGVQTRPFSAHCWVQEADALLNDDPGHAGLFTPIMLV